MAMEKVLLVTVHLDRGGDGGRRREDVAHENAWISVASAAPVRLVPVSERLTKHLRCRYSGSDR